MRATKFFLFMEKKLIIYYEYNDRTNESRWLERIVIRSTRIFNHSSPHFPLTVIAWSSVFVLRSISALGTPRKVFLPLFRATTPKDGLVLTIFTVTHDTLVSFNFIFTVYHLETWTLPRVDRMLHIQRPPANTDLFSLPSVRWKFFIHRDDHCQAFRLNDFETPISKETVSGEAHDTSFSRHFFILEL